MSEQDQVVDPQATEENVATAPDATAAQEGENKPVEPKVFTEDEVNAIVQKRIAKLERKHERERIAQQTREQIAQEQKQPAHADMPAKPKESDFETYGEYLEAVADWKVDVKLRQREIEQQTKAQRESDKSEAQRFKELQDAVIERGEEKYEDFEEVAQKTGDMLKAKGLRFSAAMVNSLVEAVNAPDIVYHLGTNLDEAERIARLPAYAQAKEIGKLEDKLQAKPQKQVSKAPEPIKPVTSGKTNSDVLSDDLPIEKWMELRNKQVRGR